MKIHVAEFGEGESLAQLRILAMQESLEAIGRFDPIRARDRFLATFTPEETFKVVLEQELIGFYVLRDCQKHLFLDHLYVHPDHQSKGVGSFVIHRIVDMAREKGVCIKLGALKGSRANKFYLSHGFVKTHEEEFDNYYEFKCS